MSASRQPDHICSLYDELMILVNALVLARALAKTSEEDAMGILIQLALDSVYRSDAILRREEFRRSNPGQEVPTIGKQS